MADIFVYLDLATGLNDGTSWTNAYQDNAGLDTAWTAVNHADGDSIWVKDNTATTGNSVDAIAVATAAALNDPIRIYGVKAATSAVPPTQSDLVPGIRTGNATRAYDQTTTNAAPIVTVTGASDVRLTGAVYVYGIVFVSADDINPGFHDASSAQLWEECSFTVSASTDALKIGNVQNNRPSTILTFRRCKFVASNAGSLFRLIGGAYIRFEDCEFALANTGGAIEGQEFSGTAIFDSCDLSGSAATLVDIAGFVGGRVEFHNCKFPASHVLTTGTAAANYFVANYGSEDNTGFNSADSEQAFEINTLEGAVDIETTAVRTGGADDEATDSGGPFSFALTVANVTDNYVGLESPWMQTWVEGDGTAQTINVYLANNAAENAANLIETNEIYLDVRAPDEAGTSIYSFWPDDGAPGDGGGFENLLDASPADLTTTSETWGTGANNDQKLTQSIAPDYRGWVYARVVYSRSGGIVLYLDPLIEVA